MNYQEFLNAVKNYVAHKFGKDYSVSLQTIEKNNGVKYEGLIIMRPGYNISPMIYLNPYYHRYLDGVSILEICNDIAQIYHQNLPSSNMDVSYFFDYKKVRPRIIPKLVNYEKNRTLLTKVPHIRFLDLAVIFQCLLDSPMKEYATILIHNQHTEYWHITVDELHQAAMHNGPLLLPGQLNNIQDILNNCIPEDLSENLNSVIDSEDVTIPAMYVLTNPRRINGASVILYEGLLSQIAKRFGKDLVVLPSSIHEVILIPLAESSPEDMNFFRNMVREVNETQVSDDEILSDQVYCYSIKEQKLQLV